MIANRKGLDRRAVPDERLKNRVQGCDEIPDSVPAATTVLPSLANQISTASHYCSCKPPWQGAVARCLNMGDGTVNYDLTAPLSRILLSPRLVAGLCLQPHPRLRLYLKVEKPLACHRSILRWPLQTYRE